MHARRAPSPAQFDFAELTDCQDLPVVSWALPRGPWAILQMPNCIAPPLRRALPDVSQNCNIQMWFTRLTWSQEDFGKPSSVKTICHNIYRWEFKCCHADRWLLWACAHVRWADAKCAVVWRAHNCFEGVSVPIHSKRVKVWDCHASSPNLSPFEDEYLIITITFIHLNSKYLVFDVNPPQFFFFNGWVASQWESGVNTVPNKPCDMTNCGRILIGIAESNSIFFLLSCQ